MSDCQSVIAITLDKESIKALKRIEQRLAAGNALAAILSIGIFSSIFSRSNVPTAAFNITQTEWGLYFEAMQGIPAITRAAVEKDIDLMIIHYNIDYDYKHIQFWKGMRNGC